jgi:biotin transport system substrate-specific component
MAISVAQPRVIADVVPAAWVRNVVLVVGAAVLVALSAQIAIPLPFTPVPLTGQTFAVLLAGAVLGSVRGMASMLLYVAMALVGLPVLAPTADGTHLTGTAVFSAPSFGYVIGFVVAAAVVGRLAERGATRTPLRTAGLMVVGNLVIYAFGVTYLSFAIGVSLTTAISLGLTPFVVGDLLKIALAAGLLPLTWAGLRKARLTD